MQEDRMTKFSVGCCEQLRELISNAGQVDIAILAKRYESLRFFVIQARACNTKDEVLIKESGNTLKLPLVVRLATQIAIKYCPFCGSDLSYLISVNVTDFDQLCEFHRDYIL